MSVQDNTPVNASNTNAGFLSRKTDSDTVAVVGLKNTATGTDIDNIQDVALDLMDACGTSEGATTNKDYANNNYIADGDNRKVAIEKLDVQVSTNAGSISTNASGISTNAGDISTNAGNISTNASDITDIENDYGAVSGLATLDASGKVPTTQMPALALTDVHVVASEVAQLALTVQEGDACKRTDENKTYLALNDTNAAMSDWTEITTSAVTMDTIAQGTSYTKPTAAEKTSYDNHLTNTSNPHTVTKAQVSLTNVTDDAQLKRAASDFSTFTEKTTPVAADIVLIEDSADSNNKKKVLMSNMLGGGGTGVDFLSGKTISDYGTFNDGSVGAPVDGTGGTASYVTVSEETSSPISDEGLNVKISKSANNAQGEGVSVAFSTRGEVDRASVQTVTIDVKTSTNYADDDFGIWVYDVTNSNLINTVQRDIKATSLVGTQRFEFQTPADSDSYRLIFHNRTTNALAYDLTALISVGPSEVVNGVIITPWEAFTPTGSWVSGNETYTGYKRRVGDQEEYKIEIALTGAPTAAALNINIPDGKDIDTNKIIDDTSNYTFGTVSILDSGTQNYIGRVNYATTTYVRVSYNSASSNPASVTNTAPYTFANNDQIFIEFSVPIVGWDSNLQLSSTTSNRFISAHAYRGSSNYTLVAATHTTIPLELVSGDTVGGYSTSIYRYTIPETGNYEISPNIQANNSSGSNTTLQVNLRLNGTINIRSARSAIPNGIDGGVDTSWNVDLTKDDYVEIRAYSTYTLNIYGNVSVNGGSSCDFKKNNTGSQTIASEEKVYAKYRSDAGQSIANASWVTVNYEDKIGDSHNAVTVGSNWKFIAPKKMRFVLSASLSVYNTSWTSGETAYLRVVSDNTNVNDMRLDQITVDSTITKYLFVGGTDTYELNKGEYIQVDLQQNTGAAVTLHTNEIFNHISIQEV